MTSGPASPDPQSGSHPRRRVVAVALIVTVALALGIAFLQARSQVSLDLAAAPRTVFRTVPFEVGATYTLGAGLPPEVRRPARITAITVLVLSGVEVLGTGVMVLAPDAIGLVPGWPPPSPYRLAAEDELTDDVQPLVGVRVLEPRSGLRGIEVRWVDADGVAGRRVYDMAVVTCTPGGCAGDDNTPVLEELGLVR